MGNSFTVVQYQRQHFGDQSGTFDDIEPGVPFAGPAKDFVFDCPNVEADEAAFLLVTGGATPVNTSQPPSTTMGWRGCGRRWIIFAPPEDGDRPWIRSSTPR